MSIKCGSAHRKHTLSAAPLELQKSKASSKPPKRRDAAYKNTRVFQARPLVKSAIFNDVTPRIME
jgi:hypothetical protein